MAELPGVVLIDMTPYVPKHAPGVSGWSLKPLAMLFSKFQELLFLDSDVLFFHDPEKLFYWRAYKSTGTLYFRDRTLPGQYLYKFTDLLIDEFSILGKQNRVYNKMGVEEGESGVIVMDKHRGGTFALLFASLLNVDPYRRFRETYYGVLGDKEAFWIANEVLKLPYSWGPGGGGAIGHHFLQDTSSVCGGLYHTDEDWEPSWFNGGLVRYKWDPVPETFEFKYIALDRSFTQLRW